jgi:hypothetical protein
MYEYIRKRATENGSLFSWSANDKRKSSIAVSAKVPIYGLICNSGTGNVQSTKHWKDASCVQAVCKLSALQKAAHIGCTSYSSLKAV